MSVDQAEQNVRVAESASTMGALLIGSGAGDSQCRPQIELLAAIAVGIDRSSR